MLLALLMLLLLFALLLRPVLLLCCRPCDFTPHAAYENERLQSYYVVYSLSRVLSVSHRQVI